MVESAEEDPMVIFRGIMSSMLGLGKNQVDEAKRLLVQARSALSAMSPTRARQYTSEGRVDGPFGLWANHLVSFVAYNWLTFLTESEKKELFDVFFLDIGCIARDDGSGSSDQIIVAPAGCFVVRALCQSLITAPSQLQAIPSSPSAEKKMDESTIDHGYRSNEHAREVARLLGFFFEESEVFGHHLFRRLLAFDGCDTFGDITIESHAKALVSDLVRAPTMLNNLLGKDCPSLFQRHTIHQRFCKLLMQTTLLPENFPQQQNAPALSTFAASVVAAFIKAHFMQQKRLRVLVTAWAACLQSWSDALSLPIPSSTHSQLLQCVPDIALDAFTEVIIYVMDRAESDAAATFIAQAALSPLVTRAVAARQAMLRVLVKGPRFRQKRTAGVVLDALFKSIELREGSSDEGRGSQAVLDALVLVATRWSEESFVQQEDVGLQGHLTELLLAGLTNGRLKKEHVKDSVNGSGSELTIALVQGISHRLECGVALIRRQGMEVGEAMAKLLEQPLHFEELDDARAKEEKTKKNVDITSPVLPAAPGQEAVTSPPPPNAPGGNSLASKNEVGAKPTSMESGLVAHDLTDDRRDLAPVPIPVYLRQVIDYLNVGDQDKEAFDKIEAALDRAADLVESNPADLEESCEPLLHALLNVEDRFNVESFAMKREQGLVSLCVACPETVLPCLTNSFFRGGLSIGGRLEVLDLIVSASAAVLAPGVTRAKPDYTASMRPRSVRAIEPSTTRSSRLLRKNEAEKKMNLAGSNASSTHSLSLKSSDAASGTREKKSDATVVSHVLGPRTRRWGYRRTDAVSRIVQSSARSQRVRNAIPATFFDLTKGFVMGGPLSLGDHPDEVPLVQQLMLTCTALVDLSRNHALATQMSQELLMIALNARFRLSPASELRQATLYALRTSLLRAEIENIHEIRLYLLETMQTDTSADVRSAAAGVLATFFS